MNRADKLRYTAASDNMAMVDSASVFDSTKKMEPKSEKEERDALRALQHFIGTYNREQHGNRKMEMISTILYEKGIPKVQKQVAIETLLSQRLMSGVKTGTLDESEGVLRGGYAFGGLQEAFDLVNLIYQYFGNESWYRTALRAIGEKCLDAPFVDESRKGHYVSDAVNDSRKLELANEINQIEPIVDFDNKKAAVVAEIGSCLTGFVDREYYTERDVGTRQGRHYNDIQSLVRTYGLELPSERDLFERDCVTAIQYAEECFAAIAMSESVSRPTDSVVERAEKAIANVGDILREAAERGHKELTLPSGYTSVATEAESTLRKKFGESMMIPLKKAYKHRLEFIQGLLQEGGASLYDNIQIAIRNFEDLVKFNPDQLSKEDSRIHFEHMRDQVQLFWQDTYKKLGAKDADVGYLAGRLTELDRVKKLFTRRIDSLHEEK